MRLDHIAFRVPDRQATAKFLIDAFEYRVQTEFEIHFNEEKTESALCIALQPPDRLTDKSRKVPFTHCLPMGYLSQEYHLSPEIFVSEGTPGSIVDEWVKNRGGIGGVHHFAYQVESVEEKMKEWQENGWAEFASNRPLTCPGLVQVFTKPHPMTGIIYEFIERGEHGFCEENVKDLMISTKNL